MKSLSAFSVISDDVETTANSDYELLQCLMCVPGSRLTPWDIIQIIHSFDLEGDVLHAFNESQISSCVGYFRKFNYPALLTRNSLLQWNNSCLDYSNNNLPFSRSIRPSTNILPGFMVFTMFQ